MAAWFDWLATWSASLEFGLATVLGLLGVECLLLARKAYRRSRPAREEGGLLGAEFGVYSASGAQLESTPAVPRQCYVLGGAGVASLSVSVVMLALASL